MRFGLDSQNKAALPSVLIAVLALTACGGSGSSQDASTPTVAPTEVAVTPTPTPESFAWMQPTPGRAAYLGDDGGGASTATVCSTADHYRDWVKSNPSGGCTSYIHGTRIVIEQVIFDPAKDTAGEYQMPLVRIHSADGTWRGYTQLQGLHPLIPKGIIVYFKRVGNGSIQLDTTQQANDGPDLGDRVTAKLVRYDPATGDADLYVTLLDGQYAGKSGWMYSLEAWDANGASLGTFAQAVSVATPGPSVDPNSRTYVTHKDIRAFNVMSECDDAYNAMSDDDARARLKDAVAAGDYVDFPAGTRLHVVDDPQPDSLFLIAADDAGNQGCVGRYELPGYGQ
jgi:hypothetical protein